MMGLQSSPLLLYLFSLLWGCCLGAVYDCLRLTRVFLGVHYSRDTARRLEDIKLPLLPPHAVKRESPLLGTVVFFEDLLFFLGTGISMILLFYQWNNGRIRPMAILLLGMGFLAYRMSFGRLVMLFSEVIVYVLETAVRYMVFFVLFPIRFLWRQCRKEAKRVSRHYSAVYQRRRRAAYTASARRQIEKNAGGLIPQAGVEVPRKRLQKGKVYVKNRKETVQHQGADPHLFDLDRHGVGSGIFKRRHEIQSKQKGSRSTGSDLN